MRIVIKKPEVVGREHLDNSNPYKNRIGFWAEITKVNSVTNTVDLISDIGQKFTSIPVSSNEWVSIQDEYVSGDLRLPPIKSRVFVLTPNPGSISGAFVLCSGYALYETKQHANFAKTKTDKEELDIAKKIVTRNGWKFQENPKSIEIKNNDEQIGLTVDTENKEIKINAFENAEIVITDSEVSISGKNITVKGQDVTITGGNLNVNGSVTPTGSGPFCGIPFCLFTGAAHSGNKTSGT